MATSNLNINRAAQSLEPGELVELYLLDLRPLGVEETWAFSPSSLNGTPIRFAGITYTPVDVTSKGWEMNGQGAFAQPILTVNNAVGYFNGLVVMYKDAIGAKLTRLRTYKQFLDGQPEADANAMYDPDLYAIEQKTKHTKREIEWKLSAMVDQEGVTLPKRKMFRDTCSHAYRRARPDGSFDYSHADCPYTGTLFYDKFGRQVADPRQDQCGLRLSDCKKRFAPTGDKTAILPTWAFPGLVRGQIS